MPSGPTDPTVPSDPTDPTVPSGPTVPADAPDDVALAELAVQARRTVDRLRVVGPRLGARGTPPAQASLDAVRRTLQHLADLAADAEGRPRRAVPHLEPHALGDQTAVLARDVQQSGNGAAARTAARLLAALRAGL